ncbi:MAG: phosphoribosylaminoimidazolesuccinocarboxamide synthase [Chitinivibrionales bacterium]
MQGLSCGVCYAGYLTGSTSTSAWTQYNNGVRNICGNILPDGMVKNQKLDRNILTPTTKSDEHDESISAQEIKEKGIIESETWERLSDIAFALFSRGQEIARKNGLILVDTKYEFGLDDEGNITLIDEIHTPDSSRYWLAETYEERIRNGQEPENIDKEFLRLWFMEHSDPYNDKELPSAPEDLIIELSHRYMRLFELITGKEFKTDYESDIKKRILDNLKDLK